MLNKKKCWTQTKVIVLIVTVAAIILFIIQLTSLPSFDKSMILEIQNSFEVQVSGGPFEGLLSEAGI